MIYMLIKLQLEKFFVFMHYSKFETCLVCHNNKKYFKNKMITRYLLFSHFLILFVCLFNFKFVFPAGTKLSDITEILYISCKVYTLLLLFMIRKIIWRWWAIQTISTHRVTTSWLLYICNLNYWISKKYICAESFQISIFHQRETNAHLSSHLFHVFTSIVVDNKLDDRWNTTNQYNISTIYFSIKQSVSKQLLGFTAMSSATCISEDRLSVS